MRTNPALAHCIPTPIPKPKSEAPRSSSSPQSSMPVHITNAIPMIQQHHRPIRVVTKHPTSYVPSIDFSNSPIKPTPAARTLSTVGHRVLGTNRHSMRAGRMELLYVDENWLEKMRVQVCRGSVVQDGFDKLGEADLKAPVEIMFIDQFGEE
ncbi:hypothetical protein L208DRAFT_1397632 [Tricholoma matsutake]|nr:hypothetical protein L208DRAFT_1397632 [Tricholoma matsutake 945]